MNTSNRSMFLNRYANNDTPLSSSALLNQTNLIESDFHGVDQTFQCRQQKSDERKPSGRWSVGEDNRLSHAVGMLGEKDWKLVSEFVGTKTNCKLSSCECLLFLCVIFLFYFIFEIYLIFFIVFFL